MTVNDAFPVTAWMFTDPDWPFIFAVWSLVCWEIDRLSLDASVLLQSRSSMVTVTGEPITAVVDERYTCELFSFAVPAQFNGADVGIGA